MGLTKNDIGAIMKEMRTVWMDLFDIDSCCQKDNMVDITYSNGHPVTWVCDKIVKCRTCDRYWVRDGITGKFWTRKHIK